MREEGVLLADISHKSVLRRDIYAGGSVEKDCSIQREMPVIGWQQTGDKTQRGSFSRPRGTP
jgi:hypothetical protein